MIEIQYEDGSTRNVYHIPAEDGFESYILAVDFNADGELVDSGKTRNIIHIVKAIYNATGLLLSPKLIRTKFFREGVVVLISNEGMTMKRAEGARKQEKFETVRD